MFELIFLKMPIFKNARKMIHERKCKENSGPLAFCGLQFQFKKIRLQWYLV